jgi:anthranilate synthase/aminodeoxychorismate synthase-like glutamine amidotransferase
MIVVIDNYDSFTYNLVALLRQTGEEVRIFRNDEITIRQVQALHPKGILLSPGPGKPQDAGVCTSIVMQAAIPILGVCLGHQLIAQIAGATVIKALQPMHGKTSLIFHNKAGLFEDVPNPVKVMRYHSLIVSEDNLPDNIEITARTNHGEIMGLKLKDRPYITGVQFHPESVLTEYGGKMIQNWIKNVYNFYDSPESDAMPII